MKIEKKIEKKPVGWQLKKFTKNDPRINRKGAPKKVVRLKKIMDELLGITNEQKLKSSDIAQVIEALVRGAKKGNINHIRELLDRLYGKSKQVIEVDEVEQMIWNEVKTYEKK